MDFEELKRAIFVNIGELECEAADDADPEWSNRCFWGIRLLRATVLRAAGDTSAMNDMCLDATSKAGMANSREDKEGLERAAEDNVPTVRLPRDEAANKVGSTYSLAFRYHPGFEPVPSVKALRAVTGLGLLEAKRLYDSAKASPEKEHTVASALSYDEVVATRNRAREYGCVALFSIIAEQ